MTGLLDDSAAGDGTGTVKLAVCYGSKQFCSPISCMLHAVYGDLYVTNNSWFWRSTHGNAPTCPPLVRWIVPVP